ncbi:MAG: hypothetical protein FWD31_09865, partial [Planctomycetaceae bacterium]|nr:hypothetical protein [Planctomycetaceae bacterium]
MDLKVVTENDQAAAYLSIRITSNHFDPAVVKVVDASTNKAVSGKVIHDTSSSSLLLVPLQSGDYAIEVKSNNSSYGDFTCDVFLPGSINGTGSVSSTDLVTANAAYQSSMGTLNAHTIAALKEQGIDLNDAKIYDACDIDGDGKVTSFEIDAIANNYLVGQVTVSIVSDHEGPVITAQLTTSVTGS